MGRYDDSVTEALYELSLDHGWPEEIAGDSEYKGWHALLKVDAALYEALAQSDKTDAEDFIEFVAQGYSKVIVIQHWNGTVERYSFKQEQEHEAHTMMVEAGEYECDNGHKFYNAEDGCEHCKGEEDAELV